MFDVPERLCHERNEARPDRQFAPHVVRNQTRELRRSLRRLPREGFRQVHVLRSPDDADAANLERARLWNDRRDNHGPFDVVGDVHGCCDELELPLAELGYELAGGNHAHPEGRTAVFVGDLVGVEARARSVTSRCTARRPGRRTSSVSPSAGTGRPSIEARRWSCTATRRFPSRNG